MFLSKFFEDFDKFNRKPFADRLTKVITKFYPFYDDAFVLSLNAPFGSGKTTFLEMWQNELINEGYQVVYLSAWQSDFEDEPLLPIMSALIENIDYGKNSGKLKSAIRNSIGNSCFNRN